ncbi:MAG: hypothetical protein AABM40_11125 [Chloroflexota bacterium]|jgi:hypothetical protein
MKEKRPTHGPAPSIWPVTLATGVGLAAVGALTSPIVIAAGALIVAGALVGWIRQALEEAAP